MLLCQPAFNFSGLLTLKGGQVSIFNVDFGVLLWILAHTEE